MFKNHLEMIGRNETPSKKAKFWQSYVRSLKGSDDIRAHETPKARSWRPYSSYVDVPPAIRSIYDDPVTPSERISASGYRYLPVHRETYGYSPRPIYDHHYPRTIHSSNYDVEKAWNDHLKRMAEIERRYPSRYGLYLKDKPNALVPLEYEPEDKPLFSEGARAMSVPPPFIRDHSRSPSRAASPFTRAGSPFARAGSPFSRAASIPLRASSLEPMDALLRVPVYHHGLRRNNWWNLLNPSHSLPISAITRDPWWWDLEDLRPFRTHLPYRSLPPFLRDSYLSPIKRNYLWHRHPLRPFDLADELSI